MTRGDLDAGEGARFDVEGAPTLRARVTPSAPPIVFTRMRDDHPQRGRSVVPRPEAAFSFQLPLIPAPFSFLRYAGRATPVPESKEPGRAYLLDISARPIVGLDAAFDNVRMFVAQSTLDDLAYDKGLRRVGGLAQPDFGGRDPILFHLASALVPALDDARLVSAAFVEHLGLTFHQHVIKTYAGVIVPERRRGGRLTAWQLRRVRDFVEAELPGDPTVSDLARACGLSTSHFTDAFKASTGLPPHRWLLRCRVDRAKALLGEIDASLAVVAASCGFYDQSHLARVFGRLEGCTPSAWRRRRRSG